MLDVVQMCFRSSTMQSILTALLATLLVVAYTAGQTTSPCQDVHTESCVNFHASRPDLCDDPTFADNMCKRFCGNCPLECFSCPNAVLHPQDCNNTTTCDTKQQCVQRHLKATDGHHEYIMACEYTELCQLLAGGFGKRDISAIHELDEETRGRFEREVVMSCCKTDLCNAKVTTTTPAATTTSSTARPTTAIPPTTTAKPACKKDVVFAIQNDVTSVHVHVASAAPWIPFVQQVVSQINVGPHNTRVAVVTFDYQAEVRWNLNKAADQTQSHLHSALSQLSSSHHFAIFNTVNAADALHQINHQVLVDSKGDRAHVKNVVVLLDSGAFNVRSTHMPPEVRALHKVSSNVLLVSVGASGDSQHYGLATNNSHMLHAQNYTRLTHLVHQVVNMICS